MRHVDPKTLEPLAQMTEAQVWAVVEEARRWRRDVAAHAYGGEGARAAVVGGVRSIEHGALLDTAIIKCGRVRIDGRSWHGPHAGHPVGDVGGRGAAAHGG